MALIRDQQRETEEERRRRERLEALKKLRESFKAEDSVVPESTASPAQTQSAISGRSDFNIQAQRGYDPRFDDPDYGKKKRDRDTSGRSDMQRPTRDNRNESRLNDQPQPLQSGANVTNGGFPMGLGMTPVSQRQQSWQRFGVQDPLQQQEQETEREQQPGTTGWRNAMPFTAWAVDGVRNSPAWDLYQDRRAGARENIEEQQNNPISAWRNAPLVNEAVTGDEEAGGMARFLPQNYALKGAAALGAAGRAIMPDRTEARVSDLFNAMQVPADLFESSPLPGSQYTGGEFARAALNPPTEEEQQPGTMYPDMVRNRLEESRQARGEDWSDPATRYAALNVYSGPEAMRATRESIQNQDAAVADLRRQAEEAYLAGDSMQAAAYGAAADAESKKIPKQYMEDQERIAPELFYQVVFDPLNLIDIGASALKLQPLQRRGNKAIKSAMRGEDEVLKMLDDAMAASSAWGNATPTPSPEQSRNVVQRLFGKTPQSQVDSASGSMYSFYVNLLADAETPQEARRILDQVAADPRAAVKGIRNVSPQNTKFGAGLYTDDVIENIERLPDVAKSFDRMEGFSATGDWKSILLEELTEATDNSLRRMHGLPERGVGSANELKLVDAPGNKKRVVFMDADGNELRSTDAMSIQDANRYYTNAKKSIKGAADNPLALFANMQRGVMSDVWLNMRPAQWSRNAVSAVGHLMTDGNMTFERIDNIIADVSSAFGGQLPFERMAQGYGPLSGNPLSAYGDMGGGGPITNRLGPLKRLFLDKEGNPYWAGTGLIGEQQMAARAYYRPFMNARRRLWTNTVEETAQSLAQAGIDPATANALRGTFMDAGTSGSKTDVYRAAQEFLNNPNAVISLDEMGLSNENLSYEGFAELRSLLGQYQRGEIDNETWRKAANAAIDADERRFIEIATEAPESPGRKHWSRFENEDDARELATAVYTSVLKETKDAARAKAESQDIIKLFERVENLEEQRYRALMDIASGADFATGRNVILDSTRDVAIAKRQARIKQEKLYEQYARSNMDYQTYRDGATQIWNEAWDQIDGRLAQAMEDMANPNYQGTGHGYADTVSNLFRVDPEDVDAIVEGTQEATKGDRISAMRQYVDRHAMALYVAAKRYAPNMDSMDRIVSAEQDVMRHGAMTEAKAAALPKGSQDAYDELWRQHAYFSEARYRAATEQVVADALIQEGGKYAPTAQEARDIASKIHTDVPQEAAQQASRPTDPNGLSAMGGGVASAISDNYRSMMRNSVYTTGDVPDAEKSSMIGQVYSALTSRGIDNMEAIEDALAIDAIRNRDNLDPQGVADLVNKRVSGDWSRPSSTPTMATSSSATSTQEAAQQAAPSADDLRYIAGQAGIGTATESGVPFDTHLLNWLNKNVYSDTGVLRSLDEADESLLRRGYNALADKASGEGTVFLKFDENPTPNAAVGIGLDDVAEDMTQLVQQADEVSMATRNTRPPTVADIAWDRADDLREARRKIDQAASTMQQRQARPPIDPATRQRVNKILIDQILPAFDNVVNAAHKVGEANVNFTMLNYNDRRGFDTLMSYFTPYHYWFTRSAKNWAERTVTRPEVLAAYAKMNSAVEAQNERENVPQRLEGQVKVGEWNGNDVYLQNPFEFIIPYGQIYGTNGFADPDAVQGWAPKAMETMNAYGFGLLPAYDAAFKYATGRGDTVQVGDYLPLYRILSDAMVSQGYPALPSAGTEWDEYGAGRGAAYSAIRGDVDPATAQFAQQIAQNRQMGNPDMQNVNPDYADAAMGAYDAGMQDYTGNRALTQGSRYMTGFGVTMYPQEEALARDVSDQYYTAGYSPENRTGSNAAKTAIREKYPWFSAWQSRTQVLNEGEDGYAPGVSADTSLYWEDFIALSEQETAEISDAIFANPGMDKDEVQAIRDKYRPQKDALADKYPNADLEGEGSGDYKSGSNPFERASQDLIAAIEAAKPKDKPTRPDDPGDEYYTALGEWYDSWYTNIEDVFTQYTDGSLNEFYEQNPEAGSFAQEVTDEAVRHAVMGQYAADIQRAYNLRYAGDAEIAWSEQRALQGEVDSQYWDGWNAKKDAFDAEAKAMWGEDIYELVDAYYQDPSKEGKAAWRKAQDQATLDRLFGYFGWKQDAKEAHGIAEGPMPPNAPLFTDVVGKVRPVGSDRQPIGGMNREQFLAKEGRMNPLSVIPPGERQMQLVPDGQGGYVDMSRNVPRDSTDMAMLNGAAGQPVEYNRVPGFNAPPAAVPTDLPAFADSERITSPWLEELARLTAANAHEGLGGTPAASGGGGGGWRSWGGGGGGGFSRDGTTYRLPDVYAREGLRMPTVQLRGFQAPYNNQYNWLQAGDRLKYRRLLGK